MSSWLDCRGRKMQRHGRIHCGRRELSLQMIGSSKTALWPVMLYIILQTCTWHYCTYLYCMNFALLQIRIVLLACTAALTATGPHSVCTPCHWFNIHSTIYIYSQKWLHCMCGLACAHACMHANTLCACSVVAVSLYNLIIYTSYTYLVHSLSLTSYGKHSWLLCVCVCVLYVAFHTFPVDCDIDQSGFLFMNTYFLKWRHWSENNHTISSINVHALK